MRLALETHCRRECGRIARRAREPPTPCHARQVCCSSGARSSGDSSKVVFVIGCVPVRRIRILRARDCGQHSERQPQPRGFSMCIAVHMANIRRAYSVHGSDHPFRDHERRRQARLRGFRGRPAAAQDRQLAQPSRVRLAEPGMAALVRSRCRHHHSLSRYDVRGMRAVRLASTDLSFEPRSPISNASPIAAGSTSFALLGISQGAAVAIEFAVRHPERVSHLVIHGGYCAGLGQARTRTRCACGTRLAELVRVGWGAARPPSAACSPSC